MDFNPISAMHWPYLTPYRKNGSLRSVSFASLEIGKIAYVHPGFTHFTRCPDRISGARMIPHKMPFPLVPKFNIRDLISITKKVLEVVVESDFMQKNGYFSGISRQISTLLFEKWNKEILLHTLDYCLCHLKP